MKTKPTRQAEDVREEYRALVSYHTALVISRFTVAAFFVAGMSFAVGRAFDPTTVVNARVGLGVLAASVTLAIWILELRTRALYSSLSLRGAEIEHEEWGMRGQQWYRGFWSRQIKRPPPGLEWGSGPTPGPDQPRLALFSAQIPHRLASYVSHSFGFDLLYASCLAFWVTWLILWKT